MNFDFFDLFKQRIIFIFEIVEYIIIYFNKTNFTFSSPLNKFT